MNQTIQSGSRLAFAVLWLLFLCWLAFFHHLGSLGLMDKTEGLFVEVARQMFESGDWVTPRWNGETFFDYPVWGYWMVALSFRLFGITAWAARLPVALAASATVLAVFALVLRLAPAGERTDRRVDRATLAATVLALCPGWIGWGRSSVTDMFLSSAITLALLGFVLAYASAAGSLARRLGHLAMALFAAIAVLAKGPVGLLLPALVIISFLLLRGRLLKELRRTPLLPMAALFLGV
ncbi:MAG TPA: glycosyltransferase family 39 protein, partial [Cyanobium sp.]|nr:glycosyltransferase family 39 protein [Cyanobium sp.]